MTQNPDLTLLQMICEAILSVGDLTNKAEDYRATNQVYKLFFLTKISPSIGGFCEWKPAFRVKRNSTA